MAKKRIHLLEYSSGSFEPYIKGFNMAKKQSASAKHSAGVKKAIDRQVKQRKMEAATVKKKAPKKLDKAERKHECHKLVEKLVSMAGGYKAARKAIDDHEDLLT